MPEVWLHAQRPAGVGSQRCGCRAGCSATAAAHEGGAVHRRYGDEAELRRAAGAEGDYQGAVWEEAGEGGGFGEGGVGVLLLAFRLSQNLKNKRPIAARYSPAWAGGLGVVLFVYANIFASFSVLNPPLPLPWRG